MSHHTAGPPDWLTKEYLQGVLRKSLKNDSILIKDFKVSAGSAVGDNFVCQIMRIESNIEKNGKTESISIIGKVMPQTVVAEALLKDFDMYSIEAQMLAKTLPSLYSMFPDVKPFSPLSYHLDEARKMIFLEDLRVKGFTMLRNKRLDLQHAILVVRSLATLHATSLSLIAQNPRLKDTFKTCFWKQSQTKGVIGQIIVAMFGGVLKQLDSWSIPEDVKRRFKALDGTLPDRGGETYDIKDDAFNVLLHGDCWVNNMMFRYDRQEVAEVRLLDFQMSYYNSIGLDLNYLVFISTNLEVKQHGLDRLFQEYHDTFVKVAGPVEGFSLERVWKEFLDRLWFGFAMGCFLTPSVISPKEYDYDSIVAGKYVANPKLFNNKTYVAEMTYMLPFFAKHGVF